MLTEFLLARIAEDEASAKAVDGGWQWISEAAPREDDPAWMKGGHAAMNTYAKRHDPARVLAECEAKRRIVEDLEEYAADYRAAPSDYAAGRRHAALLAATRVAAIYAEHPDYDDGWKP